MTESSVMAIQIHASNVLLAHTHQVGLVAKIVRLESMVQLQD